MMKNILVLFFLSLTYLLCAQDHPIPNPHPVQPQHHHEHHDHPGMHPLRHHSRHAKHHDLRVVPMVRWSFFGGLGTAAYAGNVSGHLMSSESSMFNTIKPRYSIALGAAYKINDHFMVQGELNYYGIKSVEGSVSRNAAYRSDNYQFKANNVDVAVLMRYNILPHRYLMRNHVVPYLVAGIGATTNRPQGYYNGKWELLSKLSNNQTGSKIIGIIPVGGGLMYRVSNLFAVSLESTLRFTLGSSMDGLVKNGISTTNLSEDGKAYFAQYTPAPEGIQKDYSRFNDVYGFLQVRVHYTFVPPHYRHLFHMQDINQ